MKTSEEQNERHKIYFQTKSGKYSKYKAKAKERNLYFNLTFEQFCLFWNKNCFYCNNKITTIGIDRVDNSEGYLLNNIVSCCKTCNIFKNNLSIIDWIEYIKQLKMFFNNKTNRIIDYKCKNKVNYKSNRRFSWYKTSAKKRNIEFDLSFDIFCSFISIPCHYCGSLTNVVGLDRIDNNIGYLLNNIVSCCKICNNGKQDLLYKEWITYLQKLSEFDLRKINKFIIADYILEEGKQ